MLIANETVAEDYFWQEVPFLYRTHDNPDPEKIHRLSLFIHNFGYSMKAGQEEIHPMELQKLLNKIEGTTLPQTSAEPIDLEELCCVFFNPKKRMIIIIRC